jgi:predicted AAA+ superfamily ATPase
MKLCAEYYYKNSFEVDFVRKEANGVLPIEVKWGKPNDAQLRAFMEKFSVPRGILVTRDVVRDERDGIRWVPLWKFLLEEYDEGVL